MNRTGNVDTLEDPGWLVGAFMYLVKNTKRNNTLVSNKNNQQTDDNPR